MKQEEEEKDVLDQTLEQINRRKAMSVFKVSLSSILAEVGYVGFLTAMIYLSLEAFGFGSPGFFKLIPLALLLRVIFRAQPLVKVEVK